tara:strand:- start:1582 stop:2418 length:837 start_codon:yes stop_codon:yes gene_type:complete
MGILNKVKDAFNLIKGVGLNGEKNGANQDYSLNKFMAKLQERNGLFQPSKFLVEIAPPKWALEAGKGSVATDLVFFAENINMPGFSAVPAEIKRQGIGNFDRRPGQVAIPDCTVTVLLDSTGYNLEFFQRWMMEIVQQDISKGEQTFGSNSASYGEIQYRDHYLSTIKITTIDAAANKIITQTLFECWPTTIGDITLGWDQSDQIGKLSVNFQLRSWSTDRMDAPVNEPRSVGAFEQLLRLGDSAKVLIGSVKNYAGLGDAVNVISNSQKFLKVLGGN